MKELALISLAGLLGPLLALYRRFALPVIIGEIIGGALIGPSVLHLAPTTGAFFSTLHEAGFAVLMFMVGVHLPLRDTTLRAQAFRGGLAFVVTFLVGGVAGVLVAHVNHFGHPFIVVLLVANSSTAMILPIIRDLPGQEDPLTTRFIVWLVLADALAIFLVPLAAPAHPLDEVLAGSFGVSVLALLFYLVQRFVARFTWSQYLRARSEQFGWGWMMRVNLALLFLLTWLASVSYTSTLIAGFACGIAAAALGVNERLRVEMVGVGEGFFVPLFFVTLGMTLDPTALRHGATLGLALSLTLASVITHGVGALSGGVGVRRGLVATAQIGVPTTVVTLGLAGHWLSSDQAAAIALAMILSVGICSLGAVLLGRGGQLERRGSWSRDFR